MTRHPLQSISDDDICAGCDHCFYAPGDLSSCSQDWPAIFSAGGDVVHCAEFKTRTEPISYEDWMHEVFEPKLMEYEGLIGSR